MIKTYDWKIIDTLTKENKLMLEDLQELVGYDVEIRSNQLYNAILQRLYNHIDLEDLSFIKKLKIEK